MEVLINEISLYAQYPSVKHFKENSLLEIIRILDAVPPEEINLLKSNSLWKRPITSKSTLHDILINKDRNDDESVRLKSQIASLMGTPPYWEENQKHDPQEEYLWNNEIVTSTALAEASARDRVTISFPSSKFDDSPLRIAVNAKQTIDIMNFFSCRGWVEWLGDKQYISRQHQCYLFFKDSKINFKNLEREYGFDSIDSSLHKKFINVFKRFEKMSWEEILSSDGLKYKAYKPTDNNNWFSNSPFADNRIYKFRIDQKMRCYGYRKNDIFHVLRLETDHSASDKG